MKLQPYPRYKASGVEWLGDVPEHWSVKAIKWETPVLRGASPRPIDDPVYFGDNDGEYAWVRISDVTLAGTYLSTTEQKLSRLGSSLSVKLKPGALFLSIAGSVGKPCITQIRCCIHDGFVYFPRFKGDAKFLYYLFASGEPYRGLGKLGTQLNLNTDTVGSIVAGFPDPVEQRAIAAFLDRETGRVDRLVEKKRELIERLKEKRTALISRTVTRGLPAEAAIKAGLPVNPPLKPSDIEWIGDIPKHWEVKKLKYLVSHETDTGIQIGPFGGMLTELSYDDGEFKVYGQENTLSGDFTKGQRWVTRDQFLALANYHISTGDVLFTRKGSIGGCTIVPAGIQPGIIDSDTIRLRINESAVNTSFVLYAFKFSSYLQAQVQEIKRGAILSGLNTATIANLIFIVPPLSEQAAIAAYLDAETAKLDALVEKVAEAVERLQEYRTALITAAVTGKIDVRKQLNQ